MSIQKPDAWQLTEATPTALGFAGLEGRDKLEAARDIANMLADVVKERGLAVRIGTGDHIKVEAWCFLAAALGYSPVTEWSREITGTAGEPLGYEARVYVVHELTGRLVSAAEGECRFDEEQRKRDGSWHLRWMAPGEGGAKPNHFACRSMAQTRATSKAIAQKLRWVPVLAGYEGTPAEEMEEAAHAARRSARGSYLGRGSSQHKAAAGAKAPRVEEIAPPELSSKGVRRITEKQAKRLWAIAHDRAKEITRPERAVDAEEIVGDTLGRVGLGRTLEIAWSDYDDICATVESWVPEEPPAEEVF